MNSRKPHQETAEAWSVIAGSKYRDEMGARATLLRSGGHGLLDVEVEELREFLPGSSVVHFQCSHGLDGLSLLKLGASEVAGIDVSADMIRLARELTEELGFTARWYCADVVEPPSDLKGSADLVYTGKGSLPWIADLDAWSKAVYDTLKPGGRVYVFEGHPLDNLWERQSETVQLRSDGAGYFDVDARENPGFPADAVARQQPGPARPRMREKPWRPDEVMAALGRAGMVHEYYREHPDLYWDQFPAWPADVRSRLPHSYSLRYRRPAE